ncbi:MAG: hypothetical protein NC911_08680 [Candidatus Omnitrophica bacterium]|nr:hypothetical protein [Candidatus Omnitrophota bacterium]
MPTVLAFFRGWGAQPDKGNTWRLCNGEVAVTSKKVMLTPMPAAEVEFAFSIMDNDREMVFEEFSDRKTASLHFPLCLSAPGKLMTGLRLSGVSKKRSQSEKHPT